MIKRILMLAVLMGSTICATAQINGSGFYRFRNSDKTSDYIALANDKLNYTTILSTAGGGLTRLAIMGGKTQALACAIKYLQTDIKMVEDDECINPATVVYAKSMGNNEYDLIGQSTSLTEITTGEYPGNINLTFENIYCTVTKMSGSGASSLYTARVHLKASNNTAADLGLRYFIDNNGQFDINDSYSAANAKWYIEPVTSFNVKPTVGPYCGKYYTTFYVPFAVKLAGQVEKAYVITTIEADGRVVKEVIAETGETVPAGTPVILECGSANAADNQLIPSGEPKLDNSSDYTGTNLLKGAYFCNQDGTITFDRNVGGTGTFNANNFTAYNANTMRVLGMGKTSGLIGFFKNSGTAMKSNRAWLDISSYSGANALSIDFTTGITELEKPVAEDDNPAIYDLSGRRVEGQLQKGIYIVNGKKMLIK